MPPSRPLPGWRLPAGVSRSTWDYVEADHIATDYDDYFDGNSLFEFDQSVLNRHFTRPGVMVDLGCGTGRLLLPFAQRGFTAIALDLSVPMLNVVAQKAAARQLTVDRLRANMVELDCLADSSVDYAICMFSTLGMVRGHASRQRAVEHVRRILRPGGKFVLHVHNLWSNLEDPQGRRWVLSNLLSTWWQRDVERGDKFFDYRGIPNMYLHVFTRGELRRLLRGAGLNIVEFIPLSTERRHALPRPWWFGWLRANGWIVVCQRPA